MKIEIEGYIENNYFAEDKIKVFYTEGGANAKGPRASVSIQSLSINSSNELTGYFDSTISDTLGTVIWKKL